MRFLKSYWLLPILVLSCVFILTASIPNVATGTWQTWNPMGDVRSGAAAVLLQDGRVLITGGNNANGPVASADLFGTNGNFSAAAVMQSPRSGHTATVLSDGRVLVTGGVTSGGGAVNTAEIYDPGADSWSGPTTMVDARAGHTASLLSDGRVLLAGGHDSAGNALSSLEIFDPASGKFSSAGAMSVPRMNHAAATLGDGRVLMIGGTTDGSNALASTEIYDPTAGAVSAGPALSTPHMSATATTTLDGKVAVIGGNNGSAAGSQDLASAEIFDPATGQFSPSASNLATARSGHQAFLLPKNNAILVVGGSSAGTDLNSAELYYSWADSFQATGAMSVARPGLTGSALSLDGRFLAAGGTGLASTELYGFATVKTDATDYAPGSTVTITGSGWQPGETVTLTLLESPLIDTPPAMTAVADSNGNISNNQFSPDAYDVNVRFYLTAVGQTSAFQAQNTFTDAGNFTYSSTPSPASLSIPAGNSDSFTESVTAPKNNGTFSATIVMAGTGTGPIPSSWVSLSPVGSQSFATGGASGSSVTNSWIVTISVPPGTSSGTYTGAITASVTSGTGPNTGSGTNVTVWVGATTGTKVGSLTVGPQIGTATYGTGGSVTYTVTVNRGASGTFTANLTIGALPSGVSAGFVPSSLSFASADTSHTSTLTLTTSNTAPAGSSNFEVTATNSSAPIDVATNVGALTVNQASQTISFGVLSNRTYGDAPFTVSAAGGASGNPVTFSSTTTGVCTTSGANGSTVTIVAAGTCSIKASQAGNTDYTAAPDVTQSFTVNPAALTVTAGSYSGAYDGSSHGLSDCSVSANFDGLTCTNSPAGPVGPDVGSGTVTPVVSGSTSNYSVTTNNGSWSITALAVTLTGGSYSGVYDGSTHALSDCTSSNSTFVTCTNSPTGPVGPDVGGAPVNPTPVYAKGNATDYTLNPVAGSWSITALKVTLTAGSLTGTYNGNAQSPSACSSDNPTFVTCANNPSSVGPDVGSGTVNVATPATYLKGNSTDYTLNPVTGSWSITALKVTLTAGSLTGTYNGNAQSPSACSSDNPTFVTCADDPSSVGPDVGSGTVNVATPATYLKGNSTDYTLNPVAGSWSIAALKVTLTAGSLTGTYNGNAQSPSACSSDNPTFVTCADDPSSVGPDVGSGTVNVATPATYLKGNSADYTLNPVAGSWSIAALKVTLTAGSLTGTYNGNAQSPSACSSDNPTFVTCADDPSSVGPDVGSGTVNVATPATYLKGNSTDYTLNPVTGSWSITALKVTLTAGSLTGTYNGNAQSPSACSSDNPTFVTCADDPSSVGPDVGSGTVNVATPATYLKGNSTDYTLNPVAGSWSIAALKVTLTAGSLTGTYNGNAQSPSACSSDNPTFVTCADDPSSVGPDVGSGTVNVATPATYLKGNSADYTLNPVAGSWSIAALKVTLTAGSLTGTYNGNAQSPSACSSDNPTFVTCADDPSSVGPDVGSGTVNVATPATYLKGNSTDYTLNPVAGSWSITALKVTLTAGSLTGTYNGNAQSPSACSSDNPTFVTCANDPSSVGPDVGSGTVNVATPATYLKGNSTDYTLNPVAGSWSIAALKVTLTAGSLTGTYNGNAQSPSACSSDNPTFVTCANDPSSVGPDVGSGTVAPVTYLVSGTAADYSITANKGSWSITLAPSTTVVTFESGPYVYRGTPFTATASVTGAGGLSQSLTVSYSGDCTNVTVTNGCTASASYGGDTDHKPSSGSNSITITKANPTIKVTPYNVTYDGNAHTATGTATGVKSESLSGLNLSGTTHTNPGDYLTDPWTFTDVTGNYNIASGTVHDSIGYGACSVGAGGVILPPINSNGTSVYNRKGGSTIPVKFNVCGANGAPLTDPTLVFAGTGGALTMTGAMRGTITVVDEDATNDIPDAAFTWDGQQWHFNMATMNLSSGYTYTFRINLAHGPASIQFVVGVK